MLFERPFDGTVGMHHGDVDTESENLGSLDGPLTLPTTVRLQLNTFSLFLEEEHSSVLSNSDLFFFGFFFLSKTALCRSSCRSVHCFGEFFLPPWLASHTNIYQALTI